MKTLSLKIPEKLDQRIAHEVARRKIAKSTLVREAIEKHLASPATPGKQASFLDLAGDLIGRRKGPSDLSTNPKHMAGFGR